MPSVAVRTCDELAVAERRVGDHLALEADGTQRPAARAEGGPDLLAGCGPRLARQRVVQLHLAQAVIATHEREHDRSVRLRHRHRLRGRREVDAEEVGQCLARRDTRRLDLLRCVERRGKLGCTRHCLRDVAVGRVVAVLAGDEHVLTRARRCEEVDAELAAHDPALGLDVVGLEAAPLEHSLVRVAIRLEAAPQAVLVTVERVRVFHDELAYAEQSPARARLVAVLRLEVVPELRQLLVRLELARVERDGLLVRHRQDEASSGPVLEVEDLGDLDAPGRLPELRGREHRHQHLLSADRVHLLSDDLLDLAVDAPAERHECPHAGANLADVAAAHEELVRRGLRVSRVVAQRREIEL